LGDDISDLGDFGFSPLLLKTIVVEGDDGLSGKGEGESSCSIELERSREKSKDRFKALCPKPDIALVCLLLSSMLNPLSKRIESSKKVNTKIYFPSRIVVKKGFL
jgi:hypothetical protein